MLADPHLYATDAGLKAGFKSRPMGPEWVKRFNELGVKGLADRPRPGFVVSIWSWLSNAGGDVLTPDNKRSLLGTPAAIEAMKFLHGPGAHLQGLPAQRSRRGLQRAPWPT